MCLDNLQLKHVHCFISPNGLVGVKVDVDDAVLTTLLRAEVDLAIVGLGSALFWLLTFR